MTATARSVELLGIARAVADALPPSAEEVVVTGSVSRGVADELSDIEMLIVTRDEPELDECFALAAACGLTGLGTWGPQGSAAKRVSGGRDGVPVELIWWPRAYAETAVDAVFAGELSATADAIAHGVALRTNGLLAQWQERLRHYPDELANARIEDAALTWGGFALEGLLTILRPGDRLALSSGWSTTRPASFASCSR
jgi:nucleotidyltransferase-like protein